MAKIALNNINDKCEKVDQWVLWKRQQFEKQKRMIESWTQPLVQQQIDIGNQCIFMKMKYKTKLLEMGNRKSHNNNTKKSLNMGTKTYDKELNLMNQ